MEAQADQTIFIVKSCVKLVLLDKTFDRSGKKHCSMKLSIIYFPINIPLIVTILIRSQIYISNCPLIPPLPPPWPHLVNIVSPVLTHYTGTNLANQCIISVK